VESAIAELLEKHRSLVGAMSAVSLAQRYFNVLKKADTSGVEAVLPDTRFSGRSIPRHLWHAL
jgi:hypothetical protein